MIINLLCTKSEGNRTIRGWVIDDLTRTLSPSNFRDAIMCRLMRGRVLYQIRWRHTGPSNSPKKFVLPFRYVALFRNQTHLSYPLWKLGAVWAKFPSQYSSKSSTLWWRVLSFRYVASFWNQNASKATGVEKWGHISHFIAPPPVKGEGWMHRGSTE